MSAGRSQRSRAGWAALSVALAAAWLALLAAVLGQAAPAAAGGVLHAESEIPHPRQGVAGTSGLRRVRNDLSGGVGSGTSVSVGGAAADAPAGEALLRVAADPAGSAAADAPAGEAPAPLAASDTVSMTKLVDTGTGDNAVAFNGDVLTYTIVLTNNSASFAALDILVIDTLPIDTLQDIACGVCEHIVEEQTIPEPLGGELVITVTRQLSWTVSSLAPGASTALVFTGRVVGQADGTIFKNRAFASFTMNNGLGSSSTNETVTTVRVALDNDGLPGLAAAPTWFSEDLGGTLSQDWGDFNNDGYLDLVLGSSVGTSVYRNEGGILVPYWSNNRRTYGVRWADLNGDKKLDLVAVGDSVDGVNLGLTYLYTQNGGGFVDLGDPVPSAYQYVRLAVGDFDGDGDIDVVASTNSLNADCPVRLHRNNGAGVLTTPGDCLSLSATAALGAGDFDNDGDLDLAIGLFPNTIQVLRNNGAGVFPTALLVDDNVSFLPYDFAWGDYDGNGYMDLAAAFPLQKEARIYRNLGGAVFDTPLEPFRTAQFLSPLAVDWGDFSGDGVLDLVVADEEPKVYINSFGAFDPAKAISAGELDGQVWSIRGAQLIYSADLELSLTNRDNPSHVIEGFAPHLAVNMTAINSVAASSLAWGDADGDGDIDVVYGAGPTPALGTRLWFNTAGSFGTPLNLSSGLGPQSVAFGDVNGDGRLDIAIGTAVENQLYLAGRTLPSWTASAPSFPTHKVAFGDSNSDGRLDLLVGANGGGVAVYLNTGGMLATEPVFTTPETGDVRDLAWGDFNQDFYLDFVVAFYNQPARLYLNNKNNTYTSVWTSNTALQTTSAAVADFNGDGYPDLALGHYGAGVEVYANQGAGFNGQLSSLPVWSSPTQWRTTALAWGDWDYDGYPDLAVANDNDANQVFANLGSAPGSPRLFWLWTSAEKFAATDVAWGDVDGDGDLDLGFSSKGGTDSGYYRNGTYTPSHLTSDFVPTLALPNNPTYLAVDRPGQTDNAYLFSASEVVGGISQTVTISYTLYDPDGSRVGTDLNAAGNELARTYFEFSLDGGSTWKTASPAAGWTGPTSTTTRLGTPATFVWDALKDKAISDNARFRVRVAPLLNVGPVQRASSVAVSPPFSIRGTSCVWPSNPFMLVIPTAPTPGVAASFIGGVSAGTGALTYTWDFGGGSLVNGQVAQHTFPANGSFPVTLTVSGEACPLTRPVILTQYIPVGTGQPNPMIYLPLVANGPAVVNQVADEGQTSDEEASPLDPPERGTPEATAISKPREEATPTATAPPTETAPPAEAPTEGGLPTEAAPPAEGGTPSSEPPTASPSETEPPTPEGTPQGRLTAPGAWPAAWGLGAPLPRPGLRPLMAELTATQVTTVTPGINNEPALNADGTRLTFWSTADPTGGNPDGNIEVFLIITDGGGMTVTQISDSTGSILGGFNLSTSIDDVGNQVVFFSDRDLIGQNPDSNFEIFLYDVPSDMLFQVTNTDRGYSILPSLSGNGQYIAFASDRDFTGGNGDGNTEIFRAQILGGGVFTFTQVTDSTGGVNDVPRINQDGTRIAFISNQSYAVENPASNFDNNREVFLAEMGTFGVKLAQLTQTTGGTVSHPSINADGQRVAFVSDRDPTGGPGNPSNLREIFYADVSPAFAVAVTPVTTSTLEVGNDQPDISGDGTRIAFVSPALGQVRLYDTVVVSELVTTIGPSLAPAMSADGTAMAFAHNKQLYLTSSPMAELVVSKVGVPSPVFEGQQLRYTVVVSNAGPSAAANVRMTDTLPASGLNLNGLVMGATGGDCFRASQTVITCTVGLLPARQALTLTVDVTPTTYGLLTNVVSASTDTYERVTDDDQSVDVSVQPIGLESVSVNVSGPPTGTAHLPAQIVASVSPVTASVPLTYVWEATGQSTSVYTSTSVTEAITYTWNPGGVQLITVTVSNAAAPVVSDTHVITINNPLPTIGALVPPTRTINSAQFTLVVTGTGYVSNSQAVWDGLPLATTYVNSGTLNVTVPAAQLTVLGGHAVTISNTTPGGGVSNVMTFMVNNPAPTLTGNFPLTRTAGGPTFTLNLTGTNFVAGALLWWDGLPPVATFGSGTSLTASVPASYIALGGTVNISVTNPSPSNGPSNTRPFTVTNPTLNLTPNAVIIGTGQSTVLTATISAVQAQDTVITLTSSLTSVATVPPTVILPAGSLSVTFTVQGEAQGGLANITGQLPASLGGAADITAVTVNYPAPVLTQISPVTRTAGGITFTLTLTGSDFVSGAQLAWGGLPALPTFGSGTQLTATIPANYISTTGSVNVVVNNPLPNFGPSASRPFTVTALNITLTPDPLVIGVGVTPSLTATVDAVQAADRTIVLTDSSPFLSAPPSVILPAGDTSVTFTMTLGQFRGLTAVVTATLPAAQGGQSDSALVTINNPAPTLTAVEPTTATVAQPNLTLALTGTNFVATSQVRWNGTPLTQTGFIDTAHLTGTVPPGLLTAAGSYTVTVFNSAPGGGTSNEQTVTVIHAVPTITQIQPTVATVNGPSFTLVVTGTQFVNGFSTIWWGGAPITTSFVNSTRLTTTIPANFLTTPGPVTVTVVNDPPGGGTATPPLTFTIQTDAPVISVIAPTTRTVGTGSFTLVVTGTGFVNPPGIPNDSRVEWSNGTITTTLSTTFVSTNRLSATVTNADYPLAGTYTVTVLNPDPQSDQRSNSVTFTVHNPVPTITGMFPTNVPAGSPEFTLQVTGTGFISGDSVVLWNGAPLTTAFVSGTALTATVPDTLLTTPAWVSVTVQTAGPGGGTAAPPLPFGVDHLPATLTARSPATGTVYADFTLMVTGTNIVTGTQIQWMGVNLTPTVEITPGTLQANVPQALYPVGGVYTFTLVSPEPGLGGVLATNSLTVTMFNPQPIARFATPGSRVAGSSAFTLTIDANPGQPNYLSGIQGYFGGQLRTTTFVSSTRLILDILQSDVAAVGTRAITLTNPSPAVAVSEVFNYNVVSATVNLTPTTQALLTLPATATLFVNIPQSLAAPTTITLTASHPLSVSIPPTVIDAGPTITFPVVGLLPGSVVITAQLPLPLGGAVATATVRFQDALISGLNALADDPTTLGQPTTLSATITAGTNVSYSWDFGDGSPDSPFTTTSVITHVYPLLLAGSFTAEVTARNTRETDQDTTTITINNKPVILTMSPLTPTQDVTQTITITGTGGTFLSGAVVEIRNVPTGTVLQTYSTTYVNADRLTFQLSGAHFTTAGSFTLSVVNPPLPVAAVRRSDPFAFEIQ